MQCAQGKGAEVMQQLNRDSRLRMCENMGDMVRAFCLPPPLYDVIADVTPGDVA